MIKKEVDILKYHIKEILNRYPQSLKLTVEENELTVSLIYDYYEEWNKFINRSYEWNIIRVNLEGKFELGYLKRLLQAKQFLKENYKNK